MSKTEMGGEERGDRKDFISTVDQTGWEQGGAVCGLYGIERERHKRTEGEEIEDGEASEH